MVGKPTVLYSTRPKRGPIEALLMILPGRLTTACIPRVLSVAPLKLIGPQQLSIEKNRIPRVLSVAPLKRDAAGCTWWRLLGIPRVLSVAPLKPSVVEVS